MKNRRLRDIEGYKDFKKECKFFMLENEYPGWTGTEKYGIISEKSLKELTKLYPMIIDYMKPAIILDANFFKVREESIKNSRRHERYQGLYQGFFGFDDNLEYSENSKYFDSTDIEVDYEIKEAIKTLPKLQRQRIVMHYFYQLSFTEISENEGVDESTVRKSINRSIKRLQKHFDVSTIK